MLSVFIDEAGDPGVRDGLRYNDGRHEWLCLSAAVIRSSRQLEPIEWVREMRERAVSRQGPQLHFARITKERRLGVCEILARKPVRAFCLASHKSNMRSHFNSKLGKLDRSDQFYNWCIRLLLERVSRWASDWHHQERTEPTPLDVTFATRGGHDYDHTFSYLDLIRMQIANRTTTLKGMGLLPPFLVRDHWRVLPAEQVAGCQIADTIASAVYQGANTSSPLWDSKPAEALRPIFAADPRGRIAGLGMTVWPLPHQAQIPDASRPFFRHFGYGR